MATPHNPDNFTFSRGILHIATWSGGSAGAYSDMGNCNNIEVEPIVETLAHFSKRSATHPKEKDKTTVLETGYNLTFDLDEIAAENLSKFVMGTVSGMTVLGLQSVNTEYALKFVETNPEGPDKTWFFHKCKITPNGSLALLGDEWLSMSYAAEGLSDSATNPTSPFFTISYSSSSSSNSSSSSSSG